jgi:hypothetical protein
MKMDQEEIQIEQQTQMFLQQKLAEGVVTQYELDEISLDRGLGGGTSKPEPICYADFIQAVADGLHWPKADAERMLGLRLSQEHLTPWHVELWLNHIAYTERELAVLYRCPRPRVQRALARVKRAWSHLSMDASEQYGLPALDQMAHIDGIDLDSEGVTKL